MRTFEIGKPVEHPNVKNKYRLTISFMSGDGDNYQEEEWDYDTLQELELDLNVLAAYNSISWNEQCDINQAEDWYALGGFTYSWRTGDKSQLTEQQKAFISFADNIPSDVQSDGDWQASPSRWAVTYFDDNGVEHEVTVTNEDGSKFNLCRQC